MPFKDSINLRHYLNFRFSDIKKKVDLREQMQVLNVGLGAMTSYVMEELLPAGKRLL